MVFVPVFFKEFYTQVLLLGVLQFQVLLELFYLWASGTLSGRLLCSLDIPPSLCFLSTYLISGNTKCYRLWCMFPASAQGISYFSQKLWFLLLNCIKYKLLKDKNLGFLPYFNIYKYVQHQVNTGLILAEWILEWLQGYCNFIQCPNNLYTYHTLVNNL